jgi:hypothetical protein
MVMLRIILCLILSLLFCSCGGLTIKPTEQVASIIGRVVMEDTLETIPPLVRCSRTGDGTLFRSMPTDPTGFFKMDDLPVSYRLTIELLSAPKQTLAKDTVLMLHPGANPLLFTVSADPRSQKLTDTLPDIYFRKIVITPLR